MKKREGKPSDEKAIRAHVVLRGKGGVSATDPALTPAHVDQAVATPQTVEEASRFLKSHGFTIRRVSPTSIMVEAPPRQFQLAFKAKPTRVPTDTTTSRPIYTWDEPPKIPDSLKNVVAEVVFPRPTVLL